MPGNVDIVRQALQAVFTEHRMDQIDTYFSPGFIQHSPYAPPGGRAELTRWWAEQLAVIPDLRTTVEQVVGDGDLVAVFRTVQGTIDHDLPDFGIKATGQLVTFRAADIFRVQDGQITEHWEVTDTGPLVQLAVSQLTGR
jgi:predicted SnoaL-like aldol condensation-catalyzing enzyme